MVEVFIIRLHGRALSERLMRPVGVVEALEFGQLDVQGADAELAGVELVELVAADGVGALDAAVIFGASGRQHEQGDAAPLAGGLELGHELAAAVDLHRPDIERRLADQAVEQLRDRADGLGPLDREAGLDGDARMIDLHHLAGLSPAGAAAPALSVAVELALPLGLHAPVMERDGLGLAGAHQAGDHAPGGGLAGREAALARQHRADLGAAPQREAKARRPAGRSPRSRPQGEAGRTARACRSARRPAAKVRRGPDRGVKFAVRTFGLHGALSRLSAAGFVSSAMLPQKFSRARLLPKDAIRREEAGGLICI